MSKTNLQNSKTYRTLIPASRFFGKSRIAYISSYFLFRRRAKKRLYLLAATFFGILTLVYMQLSSGVLQIYFLERDFQTNFSYPLDFKDFKHKVESCIYKKDNTSLKNAVNFNYSKVAFLQTANAIPATKSVGLFIVVKSATRNAKKRLAIRKTWGNRQYLKDRILFPGFSAELVFICGILKKNQDTRELFQMEKRFGDIVIAEFIDSYENNTFKTMLAMRYALEHAPNFKFLMIVDDDMYINLENAIKFLNSIPTTYVQSKASRDSGASAYYPVNQLKQINRSSAIISLQGKPILMGNLILSTKPYRNLVGLGSQWTTSIEEYPYNYFPPYIAGGATLFDSTTVKYLYCGSFYTRHFWIDDVYIGIIAHKLGITLTDNKLFDSSYISFQHKMQFAKLNDMIALHGLKCSEQLIELWRTRIIESLPDCD